MKIEVSEDFEKFADNYLYTPFISCKTCYNHPNLREEHYLKVRNALNKSINSNGHPIDIAFAKKVLNLCTNCNYSSPKVHELINEAQGLE